MGRAMNKVKPGKPWQIKDMCIRCNCGWHEHQAWLSYHPDDELGWGEVYLTTHLVPRGFFRRLWDAIRYIVGYRSRFGHFDEICISIEMATEIRDFLDSFIEHENEEV